jgi:hypothetical protein
MSNKKCISSSIFPSQELPSQSRKYHYGQKKEEKKKKKKKKKLPFLKGALMASDATRMLNDSKVAVSCRFPMASVSFL